jgi:hypothetical protein
MGVSCAGYAIYHRSVRLSQQTVPHLEMRGNVTQLVVDGKPFLVLGGELCNSSSSSFSYMQPIWPKLTALYLNTVLTPVSWELIEPHEGKFDCTLVDGLITAAHQHEVRLAFLWFGSWKNTDSSYVPEWVKRDTKRIPRVLLREGLRPNDSPRSARRVARPTRRWRPIGPDKSGDERVAVLAIQTGRDEFLIVGSGGSQISFAQRFRWSAKCWNCRH